MLAAVTDRGGHSAVLLTILLAAAGGVCVCVCAAAAVCCSVAQALGLGRSPNTPCKAEGALDWKWPPLGYVMSSELAEGTFNTKSVRSLTGLAGAFDRSCCALQPRQRWPAGREEML